MGTMVGVVQREVNNVYAGIENLDAMSHGLKTGGVSATIVSRRRAAIRVQMGAR
jgi:hypothetical protein